jgi:hypothetical protein
MIDSFLLKTLEKYLGKGDIPANGNVAFFCPFCHHRKKKLIVQLIPEESSFGNWHCWVCDESGHIIEGLLKRLKVNPEIVKEIHRYIQTNILRTTSNLESEEASRLFLPNEFIPLYREQSSPDYKNAIYCLKRRNINIYDILRYNLGYCETGIYAHRIIIPSYDENGNLNFFTGRTYIEDEPKKYDGPSISKNFIGFDLFINWDYPITLIEGPFDAIAYRRNAIPLFGSIVSDALRLKIIQKSVKELIIGLDQDAILKSINYLEEFYNQGISVYFLKMGPDDASKTGYFDLMKMTNKLTKIKFSDILKLKILSK